MGGLRATRWLCTHQEGSARREPVDETVGRDTNAPDPSPGRAPMPSPGRAPKPSLGVEPESRARADSDPGLDLPWLAGLRAAAPGTAPPGTAARGKKSRARPEATVSEATVSEPTVSEPTVSGDLALNRPGDPNRPLADLDRVRRVAAAKTRNPSGRLAKFATVELAWRARTQGAKKLGPRLERLTGSGWRVLHSIPLGEGASMIDHLIIGPGGVFTLSTHEHTEARVWVSGTELRANGVPVPYLPDAVASAQRVATLLTSASGIHTRVMPCLIIVTGTVAPTIVYHARPEGALILDSSTAIRVIRGLRGELTPQMVERIYEAARRRATWEIASG